MILEGEDSVREGKGRSEVHFCSSTITPTVTRDEQFRALQDRGGKGERGRKKGPGGNGVSYFVRSRIVRNEPHGLIEISKMSPTLVWGDKSRESAAPGR